MYYDRSAFPVLDTQFLQSQMQQGSRRSRPLNGSILSESDAVRRPDTSNGDLHLNPSSIGSCFHRNDQGLLTERLQSHRQRRKDRGILDVHSVPQADAQAESVRCRRRQRRVDAQFGAFTRSYARFYVVFSSKKKKKKSFLIEIEVD